MSGTRVFPGARSPAAAPAQSIAIVGGGLSSAVVSAAVQRLGSGPAMTVDESAAEPGPGLADAARNPAHRVIAEAIARRLALPSNALAATLPGALRLILNERSVP